MYKWHRDACDKDCGGARSKVSAREVRITNGSILSEVFRDLYIIEHEPLADSCDIYSKCEAQSQHHKFCGANSNVLLMVRLSERTRGTKGERIISRAAWQGPRCAKCLAELNSASKSDLRYVLNRQFGMDMLARDRHADYTSTEAERKRNKKEKKMIDANILHSLDNQRNNYQFQAQMDYINRPAFNY